jgi:hypothetical protein
MEVCKANASKKENVACISAGDILYCAPPTTKCCVK